MHNGYVRQGWILLINPTGYIVPPARDGRTPLRRGPPRSRGNEDAPLRRAGAPPPPFLDLLFFHARAPERYPFVGMSCVAARCAASARRYYITLIMRACAKGGTGAARRPRAFRFLRPEKSDVEARDGTGHAAPGNYRETITVLDLSQVVVDAR